MKRAVRLRYGVLYLSNHRVGKFGIPRPSGGRDRWFKSNRGGLVSGLGVVKFGITRRLGRRDRWFESSHLDFGATIRWATEPVSKTGVRNRLVGSTPTRSASCVIQLTAS